MNWQLFFRQINMEVAPVILTPNRRLTTYLKKQYDLYQSQLGQRTWAALDILPYESWLERLWQQQQLVVNSKLLLNPTQQQWLWEKIISQSPQAENLLQITSTAKLAQKAWQLITQWNIPLQTHYFQQLPEHRFFYDALLKYQCELDKLDAIDRQQLPTLLQELIQTNSIVLPAKIYLFGFDELTPSQKVLLESCQYYQHLDATIQNSSQYQIAVDDLETELMLMARFAKAQYLENPQQTIGCVIPNLTEIHADVVRVFAKIFADNPKCYSISAGKNLNDFPIFYAAIKLLSLHKDQLDLELISFVLHTPFCKYYWLESNARALLDKKIKSLGLQTIPKKYFLGLLKQYSPLFADKLQLFCQSHMPQKQNFNEWIQFFSHQLLVLGWPGDREINSEEYQIIKKFQELANAFISLDNVAEEVSYNEAFKKLIFLGENTLFQKQSEDDATIAVLGSLEAAGIIFDKLWVMGMDDRQFPQAAKPNPFIPLQLQKKYKIPHATAERELSFAAQLLQRFQLSAKEIIYSYAKQDGDKELSPSRLIRNIRPINKANLIIGDYVDFAELIYAKRKLEVFIDDIAPAVTENELENLYGGTSIFKHQAACPFRAFAKIRLKAAGISATSLGLSSLERGAILHKCLEIIWKNLTSQQQLLALNSQELTKIIDDAIEQALTKLKPNLQFEKPKFYAIELQRLQAILLAWLNQEKQRPAFTVTEIEQEKNLVYANIPLKIRLDRMDLTESGKYILIDYKTSRTSKQQWLGQRMDEPQLPLYCVSNDKPIDSICFAQVRVNEFSFNGLSSYATEIKGIEVLDNDWQEQIQTWNNQLTQLADEFLQGSAKVDPKDKQSCDHCDLQPFCRIYAGNNQENLND